MMYENLLFAIGGVISGIIISFIYRRVARFVRVMNALGNEVISIREELKNPEELAKTILTMKLPMDSLPADLQEKVKLEAEKLQKENTGSVGADYMG